MFVPVPRQILPTSYEHMPDPNSIQVSPRLAIPCPGLFPGQNLNQNEVNNTGAAGLLSGQNLNAKQPNIAGLTGSWAYGCPYKQRQNCCYGKRLAIMTITKIEHTRG
jgi:hypothetical protein